LGCPGKCVYCDQTKLSGADPLNAQKAISDVLEFILRHPGREKQIAFYGGTFTALDEGLRNELLDGILPFADELTSFRISTHPLFVEDAVLEWCKTKRIKTIELGIQDFEDSILQKSCRGYGHVEAFSACERIKAHGFELGIQLMPGLPGWNAATIAFNHQSLCQIKPKYLRLYPLIVIKGTPLEELYRQGEYFPLSMEEAISQCADYFPLAERNGIRIIKCGIPSNIAADDIVAGPWHPAFGDLVKREVARRGVKS
jgi:histone acetyltransferase (RNA polymerase elongator complex component)